MGFCLCARRRVDQQLFFFAFGVLAVFLFFLIWLLRLCGILGVMPHHTSTPCIDVVHFGFLVNRARLAMPFVIYQEISPWVLMPEGKDGEGIRADGGMRDVVMKTRR